MTVVTRCCESGGVLVKDVRPAAPRGDGLLGVPATGAYRFTLFCNGSRRIRVVFVADGVARETRAELLARDID